MLCPCKECMDRRDTCHADCDKYAGWKKEHEKKKEWLRGHQAVRTEPQRQFFNRTERKKARNQWGRRYGKGDD